MVQLYYIFNCVYLFVLPDFIERLNPEVPGMIIREVLEGFIAWHLNLKVHVDGIRLHYYINELRDCVRQFIGNYAAISPY